MENKQFKDLVRRMRYAQKAYFRMRTSENLNAAKVLERQVDAIIGEEDYDKQLTLFT